MQRRRLPPIIAILLLLVATAAAAHDLFLRPDRFRAGPDEEVRIALLNGTFTTSENAVTWDRVADARIVGTNGARDISPDQWRTQGNSTEVRIRTGPPGTYVVGVSTHPRVLRLEAEDFNSYLATEGVPAILELRRRNGELDRPARERYSKHVKALLQVGAATSGEYGSVLGYPAEIVPLANPYELRSGDTLGVRALVDGAPVPDLVLIAGGRTAADSAIAETQVKTDGAGMARVPLQSAGQWYVKFIHMTPLRGDTAADYESKWATLTFEVR